MFYNSGLKYHEMNLEWSYATWTVEENIRPNFSQIISSGWL